MLFFNISVNGSNKKIKWDLLDELQKINNTSSIAREQAMEKGKFLQVLWHFINL